MTTTPTTTTTILLGIDVTFPLGLAKASEYVHQLIGAKKGKKHNTKVVTNDWRAEEMALCDRWLSYVYVRAPLAIRSNSHYIAHYIVSLFLSLSLFFLFSIMHKALSTGQRKHIHRTVQRSEL